MTTTQTTNGAPKKSGRRNAITNVAVDKLDRVSLNKAAAEEGVEVNEETSTEMLSVALDAAYRARTKDLAQCDGCAGISPAEMSFCPHCGMDSEQEGIDDDPQASSPPDSDPLEGLDQLKAVALRGSQILDAARGLETETEKPARAKKEGPRAAPAPEVAKNATVAPMVKAQTSLTAEDDSVASSELLTEATLDEAVENVRRLNRQGNEAVHHLGVELERIKSQKLYTLRPGPAKKTPKWATFEAFLHNELGITPISASNYMVIAKRYSHDQVAALGPSKALYLAKLPEEERKKVEPQVLAGEIRTPELRERVKAMNEKFREQNGGKTNPNDSTKAGGGNRKDKAAKPPKQKEGATTLAMVENKTYTVKMYRAESGVDLDPKKTPRAKNVDGCVGVLELENHVMLYLKGVKAEDGTISVKVVLKREEE